MMLSSLCVPVLFAAPSSAALAQPSHKFFVDPARGSDTGDGSAKQPWQSIKHAAAAAAAAAHGTVAAPVTVTLASGTYNEALFFGPALSGTAEAPITFRGALPLQQQQQQRQQQRRAVLSGGLLLPRSAFKPRAAGPAGVLTTDLAALGVNISELGSLAPGSLGQCTGDKVELVEDGTPLTLAQWPNANAPTGSGYPGFRNWANAREVWGMGGGQPQAFTLVPNASDTR